MTGTDDADRSGSGIRVLLVDDSDDIRLLVRTALELRGGFEVVGEAGTGAEARRLAAELSPDVVLLDLTLPDLAGRELLTQVGRGAPDAAVVVFSGNDPDDRAWYEKRVSAYVMKNEELGYLVDLLESAGRRQEDEAVAELPREPESVRASRSLVRRQLKAWQLDELEDAACLVVSELATNAINHAGSALQVRLMLTPATVRVEVRDDGTGTPEPQAHSATREDGRGLLLVAAMSLSWGIDQVEEGKVVWAELARTST